MVITSKDTSLCENASKLAFSMSNTKAALSDTPERQTRISEVNVSIINQHSATTDVSGEVVNQIAVFRKYIHGQRLLTDLPHEIRSLFQVGYLNTDKIGPKISSCISTLLSMSRSVSTVGEIYRFFTSLSPPSTTVAFSFFKAVERSFPTAWHESRSQYD